MALGSDTQSVAVDVNTAAANSIVAAVSNARIQVVGYALFNSVATAQTIRWRGGASNNLTGVIGLPSSIGGSAVVVAPQGSFLFQTNANEALNLVLSAATAVAGHIFYRLHYS